MSPRTSPISVDELIDSLKAQLDAPELRAVLEGAGFRRKVDVELSVTLYVDRGVVPKPMRFTVI